ncbi:hypothetical protein HK098_003869 [Nowakowskiella sp. JEL0407]|nr:hypothetical protein HK098_003869 [Nowakowskiella sp. JEL0407]
MDVYWIKIDDYVFGSFAVSKNFLHYYSTTQLPIFILNLLVSTGIGIAITTIASLIATTDVVSAVATTTSLPNFILVMIERKLPKKLVLNGDVLYPAVADRNSIHNNDFGIDSETTKLDEKEFLVQPQVGYPMQRHKNFKKVSFLKIFLLVLLFSVVPVTIRGVLNLVTGLQCARTFHEIPDSTVTALAPLESNNTAAIGNYSILDWRNHFAVDNDGAVFSFKTKHNIYKGDNVQSLTKSSQECFILLDSLGPMDQNMTITVLATLDNMPTQPLFICHNNTQSVYNSSSQIYQQINSNLSNFNVVREVIRSRALHSVNIANQTFFTDVNITTGDFLEPIKQTQFPQHFFIPQPDSNYGIIRSIVADFKWWSATSFNSTTSTCDLIHNHFVARMADSMKQLKSLSESERRFEAEKCLRDAARRQNLLDTPNEKCMIFGVCQIILKTGVQARYGFRMVNDLGTSIIRPIFLTIFLMKSKTGSLGDITMLDHFYNNGVRHRNNFAAVSHTPNDVEDSPTLFAAILSEYSSTSRSMFYCIPANDISVLFFSAVFMLLVSVTFKSVSTLLIFPLFVHNKKGGIAGSELVYRGELDLTIRLVRDLAQPGASGERCRDVAVTTGMSSYVVDEADEEVVICRGLEIKKPVSTELGKRNSTYRFE